jgi:hypothetical protein
VIPVSQPEDVLEQERPWSRFVENAEVVIEQAGLGVATRSLVLEPVAGLREGSARRATHEKCGLARAKVARAKNLASLNPPDVALEDGRSTEVRPDRLARVAVMVQRDSDPVACPLDAEVEASRAAEQADGRQLRHAPFPSRLV